MELANIIKEQLSAHLKKDEISFSESDNFVEFEIAMQNINLEVNILITDLFTVLYTLVPLNLAQDKLSDLYVIINFLNTKTPFGNFEYDPSTSSLFYRASASIDHGVLAYEVYEHLLNYSIFTIESYLPFLNSLNSGILSIDETIEKIENFTKSEGSE